MVMCSSIFDQFCVLFNALYTCLSFESSVKLREKYFAIHYSMEVY